MEDVADRARRWPLDVGLDLGEASSDLARTHVGKAAAEGDDLVGNLVTRAVRNAERSARAIAETGGAVRIVASEPLVKDAPADAVTR